MLKGADTLALPESVPEPVFCTVNVLSAVAPTTRVPNDWLAGVTLMTGWLTGALLVAEPLTWHVAPVPPVNHQ